MRSLVPGRDFRSSLNFGSHKKSLQLFSWQPVTPWIFFFWGGYRLCHVPEIKSYILSWGRSVFGRKNFFSGGSSLGAIYRSSGSSFRAFFCKDNQGKLTALLEPLRKHYTVRRYARGKNLNVAIYLDITHLMNVKHCVVIVLDELH